MAPSSKATDYAVPVLELTATDSASDFVVTVVEPIRPDTGRPRGCHDWPFALLFLINIAAMGGAMVRWGLDTIRIDNPSSSSNVTPSNDALSTVAETRIIVCIALAMAALSLVLSLLTTVLVSNYTHRMIQLLHWMAVVTALGATVAAGFMKAVYIALLCGMMTIGFFVHAILVDDSITFVVVNVRIASIAIARHWSSYIVAILFSIAQAAWTLLCLLVVMGVAKHTTPDDSTVNNSLRPNGERCKNSAECMSNSCRYDRDGILWISHKRCAASFPGLQHATTANYIAYFCLLLSLYWGLEVLRRISNTTVAGAVAAFWYGTESTFTTCAALCRSLTTSFGSICFGSLVGSLVQVLRLLAVQARREGSILGCLAECVLDSLGDFMDAINHWAYVYVAMYGLKFTHAGRAVLDLFGQRNFNAIAENNNLAVVLSIAAVAIGLLCASIGALLAVYTDLVTFNHQIYFLSIMGFCVGAGIAITPLSALHCAVSTIIVCYAEDPAAFAAAHPELHATIVADWYKHHPGIMLDAGYSTTHQTAFRAELRC